MIKPFIAVLYGVIQLVWWRFTPGDAIKAVTISNNLKPALSYRSCIREDYAVE